MALYSLYHELRSQYKCDHDGVLIEEVLLHDNSPLYNILCSKEGTVAWYIDFQGQIFQYQYYAFSEATVHRYELSHDTHVGGLLFFAAPSGLQHSAKLDFRSYFAFTLLNQQHASTLVSFSNFLPDPRPDMALAINLISTQDVCHVFEDHLLFQGPENDKWHQGRSIFEEKVNYYVRNRARVRFCLPAFPCKSSNPEKVASPWPDGAEYEALTNLFTFCVAVKKVYPPGGILEIVSDGHVFSDCVGVDDEQVTEYTRRLQCMARAIQEQWPESGLDKDCVTFQGLREILYPNVWLKKLARQVYSRLDSIFNPVNTRRTP